MLCFLIESVSLTHVVHMSSRVGFQMLHAEVCCCNTDRDEMLLIAVYWYVVFVLCLKADRKRTHSKSSCHNRLNYHIFPETCKTTRNTQGSYCYFIHRL